MAAQGNTTAFGLPVGLGLHSVHELVHSLPCPRRTMRNVRAPMFTGAISLRPCTAIPRSLGGRTGLDDMSRHLQFACRAAARRGGTRRNRRVRTIREQRAGARRW